MRKLYFNGTIITVNENRPTVEAVLIENGKIIKVGSKDEVFELKDSETELVDLEGKRCCLDLLIRIVISRQSLKR